MVIGAIAMVPTLSSAGWSLSALPRVNSTTGMGAAARSLDPGFHTVRDAYDGQFYWGIAIDPLATGTLHHSFDKTTYRYGHPLYGWLAWVFSAGRAAAVPAALAFVGLASLFAAAAAAAALGIDRGRSGWEGLFVALNVGLISSAVNDLAEPLAAALMLSAFVALTRGARGPAWVCLALLPLAKEPLIVVTLAVVGWELAQHRRRSAALFSTTVIPALLWWTYARIHLGAWFTTGDTALGKPFAGWYSAFAHNKTGGLAVAILVPFLAVLVLAALRALRTRGPVGLSYAALAAIAICLAPNATVAFTTAMRNTAFLVALVPFVLVSPPVRARQPA